jgi:hypothetical protein
LPESRDIRRLGVPVERIRMFDADMLVDTGHGHAALCEGFHEDEETHRWTDGVARIPNRWISNFAGAFTLELLLFPTRSRYRVAADTPEIAEVAAAVPRADEAPAAAPKKKKPAAARRKRA